MAGKTALAIEIGRGWIRAALVARDGRAVEVRRAVTANAPAELDPADAEAFGGWVGATLKDAGIPRMAATIAISREHVGLKRLTLPTIDDDELPQMTRLALRRELSFDADRAIVDFVPVERTATSTRVLAVAVPESVRAHLRAIIEGAGFSVERAAFRALGSSVLLGSSGLDAGGGMLGIDVVDRGVEFCVVGNGEIRFSRSADISAGDDPAVVADAIVTETRRTWMSYRIVEGESDVSLAVMMGAPAVTTRAVEPIGQMLQKEAVVLEGHPLVSAGPGVAVDEVWPLVGLLLEPALGRETIDFVAPRRAVDRHAILRRRGVLAAGAFVVALFAVITAGRLQKRGLEAELSKLEATRTELRPRYAEHQRNAATLTHLRQWEGVDAHWLDHLVYLQTMMPPSREAVLDSWGGTLEFRGVRYDKKDKAWSAPGPVTIVVEGEARDRATADEIRAKLVGTTWYTASSSGADAEGGRRLPFGYTYRLGMEQAASPLARADDQTGDREASE